MTKTIRDSLLAAGSLAAADDMRAAHQVDGNARRASRKHMRRAGTAAVIASGIPHLVAAGGVIQFREPGKPAIDFFPDSGRARIVDGPLRSFGGADWFLTWYRKQARAAS